MAILITGIAGFIGYSFAEKYLEKYPKSKIIGVDNINNYYSRSLKLTRLKNLKKRIKFYKINTSNKKDLEKIFKKYKIIKVYNFAAQAGVRYSIKHPSKYQESNIEGFFNILEFSRLYKVQELFYASSSSVYGESKNFPLQETEKTEPKNFYGLTKKINEQMAENYSKNYKMSITGLRFFTVYGEWGRPDMFIIKLLDCISKNKNFYLNKSGNHYRDFTNIKDVANICHKLLNYKCKKSHTIFNVCAGKKVNIKYLADKINNRFKNAKIVNVKANKADVNITLGDNKKITKALKYKKFTNINNGLNLLIKWYLNENIKKII